MNQELIEEKFNNQEEKIKNHESRLKKLEDTYSTLQNLSYRMTNIESTCEKIDKKLDIHTNKKTEKYEKLIDYLFYAVLGALLAYIAYKLGLK